MLLKHRIGDDLQISVYKSNINFIAIGCFFYSLRSIYNMIAALHELKINAEYDSH